MADKTTIVDSVSTTTKLNKIESGKALNAILDSIKDYLKKDGKVKIVGFGNFEVREYSSKKGINPQTGESIEIEARSIPAFKPGKRFKELVNHIKY